jgi:hypothetical protein
MSTTGLEVFDQTLQKTNIWLKDIMGRSAPTGSGPIMPCAPCCTRCATA